jgi:hypothetical protein
VKENENNQLKLDDFAPGCRETVQPEERQRDSKLQKPPIQNSQCSKPMTVTLTLTPEEYSILSKASERWTKENPEEWKRENMIINFCKDYLAKEKVEKCKEENKGEIVILDSPYQVVVVTHCEKCGDNHITTDKGVVKVDEAEYEIAMENGRVLKIGNNGKTGENRRTISAAKKKKIILRDGCKCAVCGRTKYLHVHHIEFISAGGKDNEENMICLCSVCHALVHKHESLIISGLAPHNVTFSHIGPNGIRIPFGS